MRRPPEANDSERAYRARSEAKPEKTDTIRELPPQENDESSAIRESTMPDYAAMSEDQLEYLASTKIDDDELLEQIPPFEEDPSSVLMDVVGVKLQASGPVIMFDCSDMYLEQADRVVVETGRGLAFGEVVVPARRRLVSKGKLPRVIRKASTNDLRQQEKNEDRQNAAYRLCKDRIERLSLPMKLIKVEYLHGGNKAVFYFSAEGRIDFRELVRDLAKRLHTRIEMRQIGVRDASRMLGGVGTCGCQLCCNLYLRDFQPVSIRMAKDQNIVLNPQKVSGICGRLLCCLTYEDDVYREAARAMPKLGRRVMTPDGEGRVRDRDVLKRLVRVQLATESTLKEYSVDDIQRPIADNRLQEDDTEATAEDQDEQLEGIVLDEEDQIPQP